MADSSLQGDQRHSQKSTHSFTFILPRPLPVRGSAFTIRPAADAAVLQSVSIENSPAASGPAQFKILFFKGQLYMQILLGYMLSIHDRIMGNQKFSVMEQLNFTFTLRLEALSDPFKFCIILIAEVTLMWGRYAFLFQNLGQCFSSFNIYISYRASC